MISKKAAKLIIKEITDHDIYKGNVSDINMLYSLVASHIKIFGKRFKDGSVNRGF